MKISFQWLSDYVRVEGDAHQLAEHLTSTGLEVEAVELHETIKGGLQGIVIGEVLEKTKHPDADRLSITKVKVDGNGTIHQIVCGAANVAAGQKVVVALPGAKLYPTDGEPFVIKKSKIRGAESEGMICAEDEIGLGKSHEGIMVLDPSAKIGTPAADYFNIKQDYVLHIGLTPNRVDAASHIGVARDVAALYETRLNKKSSITLPQIQKITATGKCPISIKIENPTGCKRYAGVVIENATVTESPDWLKSRLASIGLRPINVVVDITNYVMHECGQPLHAFDADKITGNTIIVKNAVAGSTFVTLDEVERKLTGTDMMICNAAEPMCIAGIFGGTKSGITTSTKRIFIESAWFNPVQIRKSARHHALFTDASFRFERGTDPEMVVWALQRAASLIMQLTGGKLSGDVLDVYPDSFKNTTVAFSLQRFTQFSGVEIAVEKIKTILAKLDIEIIKPEGSEWSLKIPLYRVDVHREADVYEEILRIFGYDNIPFADKLSASLSYTTHPNREKWMQAVSDFLSAKGFNEILTNSLTSGAWNEKISVDAGQSVKLLNPLSQELDVLRASLLAGGLVSIAYNKNRQVQNMRFYEWGKTYSKNADSFSEQEWLGIWITGNKTGEHWMHKPALANWYTLLEATEGLLDRYIGLDKIKRAAVQKPGLINAFTLSHKNQVLVSGGEVADALLDKAGIDDAVFYAEINWEAFLQCVAKTKTMFTEIARFPFVRRDLSLLLDETVTFESIKEQVYKTDHNLVQDVFIFDHYRGEKLPAGKKSYAIGITLQHAQRTLTDTEVEEFMTKVVKRISESTGAVLR